MGYTGYKSQPLDFMVYKDGEKGDEGPQGKSVESSTRYYALVKDPPTKPQNLYTESEFTDNGVSWSKAPPAYTDEASANGLSYYESTITIYDDESWQWSEPVKQTILDVDFIKSIGVTAGWITSDEVDTKILDAKVANIGGFTVDETSLTAGENDSKIIIQTQASLNEIVPVDYIQFDGSQYIDTGIVFDINKHNIEIAVASDDADQCGMVFGTWYNKNTGDSDQANYIALYFYKVYDDKGYVTTDTVSFYTYHPNRDVGNGEQRGEQIRIDTTETTNSALTKHIYNISNKKILTDNKIVDDVNGILFTEPPEDATAFLGAARWIDNNNSANWKFKGKIYSLKIWENNELILDYLPVKNENAYGFWDLCKQEFKSAEGLIGPNIDKTEFNAIALGSQSSNLAPIQISNTGKLVAQSGEIGGLILHKNGLFSEDKNTLNISSESYSDYFIVSNPNESKYYSFIESSSHVDFNFREFNQGCPATLGPVFSVAEITFLRQISTFKLPIYTYSAKTGVEVYVSNKNPKNLKQQLLEGSILNDKDLNTSIEIKKKFTHIGQLELNLGSFVYESFENIQVGDSIIILAYQPKEYATQTGGSNGGGDEYANKTKFLLPKYLPVISSNKEFNIYGDGAVSAKALKVSDNIEIYGGKLSLEGRNVASSQIGLKRFFLGHNSTLNNKVLWHRPTAYIANEEGNLFIGNSPAHITTTEQAQSQISGLIFEKSFGNTINRYIKVSAKKQNNVDLEGLNTIIFTFDLYTDETLTNRWAPENPLDPIYFYIRYAHNKWSWGYKTTGWYTATEKIVFEAGKSSTTITKEDSRNMIGYTAIAGSFTNYESEVWDHSDCLWSEGIKDSQKLDAYVPTNKDLSYITKEISFYENSAPIIKTCGSLVPYCSDTSTIGTKSFGYNWGYIKNIVGTCTGESSKEIKNSIKAISEDNRYTILFDSLKPVSFKFNNGSSNRTHMGFIAEDVKNSALEANFTTQDIAAYVAEDNGNGKAIGLRYTEFIALNTNEVQKLKKRVSEQENTIKLLEDRIKALEEKIK